MSDIPFVDTFLRPPHIYHILMVGIAIMPFVMAFPVLTHAETGQGDDVFRVIMTIFGVDRSRGDVVAIVTVNNGEASKVRFLDSDTAASGGIIEYVATFPNVTVNAGVEYNACVLTTADLEPLCTTGNNSPALRPEFVDVSLNATSEVDQTIQQEGNSEDDERGDED
jgi:hypothetical protein